MHGAIPQAAEALAHSQHPGGDRPSTRGQQQPHGHRVAAPVGGVTGAPVTNVDMMTALTLMPVDIETDAS